MTSICILKQRSVLTRFTMVDSTPRADQSSLFFLTGSLLLVLIFGLVVMSVEIPVSLSRDMVQSVPVSIRLQMNKEPEISEPAIIAPLEVEKVPVIEPETILSAPVDRPAVQPEKLTVVAPQEAITKPAQPVTRRVYGVRKVYAKGLGKGSAEPSGLVNKLGNTVDGRSDDLIATEADLQGKLAALSSVDQAPEPIRRIKPVYSNEMLKARVRGVVTAYLLVDVDGTVKDVKVTEDIGLDSRQVATRALNGFKFKSAQKNGSPVAVWILHRIRFEFQE